MLKKHKRMKHEHRYIVLEFLWLLWFHLHHVLKIFSSSWGLQGTTRVPLCSKPYSCSACSSKRRNEELLKQSIFTTNLFFSDPFIANTAKCPSFTSSGTVVGTSNPSSVKCKIDKRLWSFLIKVRTIVTTLNYRSFFVIVFLYRLVIVRLKKAYYDLNNLGCILSAIVVFLYWLVSLSRTRIFFFFYLL